MSIEKGLGREENSENYQIPQEIQTWVDDFIVKEGGDLLHEEWTALWDEFKLKAKENPEYQLAYLRHRNPDEPTGEMIDIEKQLIEKRDVAERKAMKEQAENTPVNPENNILTHYEETLDRMAQIEGVGWKNSQEADEIQGVRKTRLKDASEYLSKIKRKSELDHFIVYGSGGWNRYIVRGDGSVELSAQHSNERDILKAKLLGFKVFGEIKNQ